MDTVPKIFRPIYDYLTNSCDFATINQKSPVAALGFDMTWLVLRLRTIFEAFTYDKGDLLSRSWNRGQRHGVEPSQSRQNLAAAVALGFGTENASALIKALEKAGVELKGS
jgi:hypothetical protein